MGHTPSFNLLGMTPKDTNAANLVVNSTLTQMSLSGANVLLSPGSDVVNNNAPTVYNPGVKGTASSYYQAFAGQDGERDALDFAEQVLGNVKKSDIRIVDEDELCVLGDTLLTLASNLAVQNRDLVIFQSERVIAYGRYWTGCWRSTRRLSRWNLAKPRAIPATISSSN